LAGGNRSQRKKAKGIRLSPVATARMTSSPRIPRSVPMSRGMSRAPNPKKMPRRLRAALRLPGLRSLVRALDPPLRPPPPTPRRIAAAASRE